MEGTIEKQHNKANSQTPVTDLLQTRWQISGRIRDRVHEYRLSRLAWVSPLVLIPALLAGMLLEGHLHWFSTWFADDPLRSSGGDSGW